MKKTVLFILWAVLFALCAGLGFIPEPRGFLRFLMIVLSLGFFVPGGILLYDAAKCSDKVTLRLIRNLSAASLAVTLGLLVANLLSVLGSEGLGDLVHIVLTIVSSPMICGQYWVVSMFLWACLLIASLSLLNPKKA